MAKIFFKVFGTCISIESRLLHPHTYHSVLDKWSLGFKHDLQFQLTWAINFTEATTLIPVHVGVGTIVYIHRRTNLRALHACRVL